MNFPRLLYIQSFINITFIASYQFLGLVFGFLSVIGFIAMLNIAIQPAMTIIMGTNFVAQNLIWMSGIVTMVYGIKRNKYAYAAVVMFAIPSVVLFICTVANAVINPSLIIGNITGIIFNMPVAAWAIYLVVRPYHIKWARTQGGLFPIVFNPFMIAPVLLLLAMPSIVVLIKGLASHI